MTKKNIFPNSKSIARVLIVDDHPALREGLEHWISSRDDLTVCGQACDVDEALALIRKIHPDIVIVDIALKNSDGLDFIKEVKSRHPSIRTLAHSMYDETLYADRCLRAGAMGFVNKTAGPEELIKAIHEILAGGVYLSSAMTRKVLGRSSSSHSSPAEPIDNLTDRQLEIFRLMGEGLSAAKIAERLFISVHTVESHRENIKRKLEIESTPELNRRATLWVARQG